jgi:hypothetical protein
MKGRITGNTYILFRTVYHGDKMMKKNLTFSCVALSKVEGFSYSHTILPTPAIGFLLDMTSRS